MDISKLLQPISDEAPCGEDLEYDSAFLALEKSAVVKPEQQFGDTIVPAEEPDWKEVQNDAVKLFARTHDLRVAILLARALTHTEGMVGLATGLQLVQQLLAQYWAFVHPCLDPDDGDPTARVNALLAMVDSQGMLRDIRTISFTGMSKHEKLTVRELLIAAGHMPSNAQAPSLATVQTALAAAYNADFVQHARVALTQANQIRQLLNEQLGVGEGPDLSLLSGVLKNIVQVCDQASPATTEPQDVEISNTPVASVTAVGEIRSRDDVVQMLEKVCTFLERTEPANPAPLLIRRAQRLVTMSFVEIIQELTPDSLDQIYQISGSRPDDE